MGLDISVGYLADVAAHDATGAARIREDFKRANVALVQAGVPQHHEPETLDQTNRFSCQMWGYSGLHYLRRVAAFEALGLALPAPGDDSSSRDVVVQRYYREVTQSPGFVARLLGRKARLSFQHLMVHSDAEGYYVP